MYAASGRRAVLKLDITGPKGCAGALRRIGRLRLFVCRPVSLLRGCWVPVLSENDM